MRKTFTKEQVRAALEKPNGTEQLMEDAEAVFAPAYELFLEGVPAAAALLCRMARRKAFHDKLNETEGCREAVCAALKAESPKLRKNAARLLGQLGTPSDAGLIISALESETTRFVRPSMLLSLGALGGAEAQAYLEDYAVAPAADESEKKHADEEQAALDLVKKSFVKINRHEFTALSAPAEIELRTPDRLSESLASELEAIGIRAAAVHRSSVRVHTEKVSALFAARSFFELLFPFYTGAAYPKGIGIKASTFMRKFLPACHSGEPPFGYRIEIRGEADRAVMTREIAKAIDGEMLVNSPGNYDVELRVELRDNGNADLYLKLYTLPDHRFDYRIGALPASMHPVTAAAVLRYASEYLAPNARVLDPCCGSGTFLFEREKLTPCDSLTGVDIAHAAIDIARKNALAAESKAKFVTNDCLRFEVERPYDELIANLPFGNRVGSHHDNLMLYAAMLDKLPHWLKKGGVALLYTMEYTLLKKLIRERNNLKLITEVRTDAGGLTPTVFLLKVQ